MMEFAVSTHAMEQFQNRMWLKEGVFVPWGQLTKKIFDTLNSHEVFPTNEPGIGEYRVGDWVFVIGMGERSKEGVPYVITAKLRLKSSHLWSCQRRTSPVHIYITNKDDLVSRLQWGSLNSKRIFEFSPHISLREILYALRSFGCKISPECEWQETYRGEWVAIPIFTPSQPLGLNVMRRAEGELAVLPVRKNYGSEPMVVSEMNGQYEPFQQFINKRL